tara:strand:+ start:473 stop:769 length:297 start_codon:yes stop_codon:yes gene_type:complete
MEESLSLIGDLGAPIAVGIGAGVFIFVIMKQIFDGLVDDIGTLKIFASSLTTRVKTMNNDMIKIDAAISNIINVKPPLERMARAENFVEDGTIDTRRD